jgi:putative CocE/NonD family hydrolase
MGPEQQIKVHINTPVPMRDGTVLRADLYRPDDGEKHPTLIIRMPYNKAAPRYHVLLDPLRLSKAGYAVLWQDCRGTMASDGEFNPFVAEAEDGYDTIEWASTQSWSNGTLGMYGISYFGATQLAAASLQPAHLKAFAPGMIGPTLRDLFYVGGAFQIHAAFLWGIHMSLLKLARNPPPPKEMVRLSGMLMRAFDNIGENAKFLPLKEQPVLKETGLANFYFDWLSNPDDNEFWQESRWVIYESTTIPAFLYTGWYDILLRGTLARYSGMKEKGGSAEARNCMKLVIGPWFHHADLGQQAGDLDFGIGAAAATIDLIGQQIRWFDYWLKGVDNGIMNEPPVRIFVMGENIWRNENEWPLARAEYTPYYFHSSGGANTSMGDGLLSTEKPADEAYDTYLYDPRNPTPTRGGSILTLTSGAGALDQTKVESRTDVLVYTSLPLKKNLEVTGPVQVKLFAASSAVDTDFTAKLVDVWPDGRAFNLTDGIIRARYRESERQPSLLEPGRVYEYTIDLIATSNLFKTGHRIRVEISSSNFPRYDRNPNTGNKFGEEAGVETATQRIFHDKERPSQIFLPVIPR